MKYPWKGVNSKLLERLQANKGKKIVLELSNGKILSGTVIAADQKCVRLETDSGVGIIPVDTVQIIWEPVKRSLTEENMEVLAQKFRDSYKDQIACTGFPAFTCGQSYICRPPDSCSFSFTCLGRYVPGPPSAGGGCPVFLCKPFQFGQPCGPLQFGCGPFQFGQPCGPLQFGCRPSVFGCGPFQFGQPCRPFTFGCRPFQFGGSQCGAPGGFVCPGQQFIGIAGPSGGS